jgi:hypothetical protein
MEETSRDSYIKNCEMKKQIQDTIFQIVDEILSEMPLEERVSLSNMKKKDIEVLQGVFDLYIRSKVDPEDDEYTEIINELWKRLWKTHRLRVVK